MYTLDRKAFAILAGRLTGKQSLRWQIDFIDAFDAMEIQLKAHVAREAAALHQLRPLLAPVVTGTQQGLRRAAIGLSVNRSDSSITYHRRVARTLGLLPAAN
jgi:phage regulator Rha-like protein